MNGNTTSKQRRFPIYGQWERSFEKEFKGNKNVTILIEGHTDKRGPVDQNLKLSQERAQSIKKFFVENFGIDESRLLTKGHGPWKRLLAQR